jgi:hypothetical protein
MFGFRPEGRALTKGVDAITRVTPYIMTERSDAQCYCTQYADYMAINEYLKKKRAEGYTISTMSVIIAAYVRAVSQFPELNRFIVGKKLYARQELCVSFAIVKVRTKVDFLETTVKVYFDPYDTIFDVARKIEDVIARNKKTETENKTDRVANTLLSIPGLIRVGVGLLKAMDRIGIMPRAIVDASPFHTSMFITNMASLGMNELHHHLYNFGTTTVFIGLGKQEPRLKLSVDGKLRAKRYYPMAIVTDERVAAGAMYGMAFNCLSRHLRNPELLEIPPEQVRYDHKAEYRCKEDKTH